MTFSAAGLTKGSLLGTIFLASLSGNFLVAYVLIKHRKVLLKNRPTYKFIFNIILSDLVVTTLTMPFEIVSKLLGTWIFGRVPCKIVEFLEIAVSGTAVFTHAMIAADRYRSLAHPHLPKMKEKLVKQMIASSWIVPAVISSAYLYMFEVQELESAKPICTAKAIPVKWLDKLYEAVEFAIVFLFPFVVLCWCYFHVTLVMWGRSPQVAAAVPSFSSTYSFILHNKRRVTRTASLVAAAFFICWLPTLVLSVVRIVSGTEAIHRGHALHETSMFGAFVNEAINPVIYCAFDRNIKLRVCFCTHGRIRDSTGQDNETPHSVERRPQEIAVRTFDQTQCTTKHCRIEQ